MINYHETTDEVIIPFSQIIYLKKQNDDHVRVVFNGNELALDRDEMYILKDYKEWLIAQNRLILIALENAEAIRKAIEDDDGE